MPDWGAIEAAIADATGAAFRARRTAPVGGGCIHSASVLDSGEQRFFVKTNRRELLWLFEAEAAGLEALAATGSVRVPRPLCHGETAAGAFLVLEYLVLRPADGASAANLGARLAELHALPQPCFGFDGDNAIGATPQPNPRTEDWVEFFARHRIGFQLELAARAGRCGAALRRKGETLCGQLGEFFGGYSPAPSLLHGDLWSGNFAALEDGQAVIFDPAVYWGDHETDIAMSELFGGFPKAFYDAYAAAWPLDAGYAGRRTLYNLYHVLNHLNLFGGGYGRQAEGMLDLLLAELG